MDAIKGILLKIVHYLTYLDLIAKVLRRVATKFMPGWMVDLGYYVILGVDWIATQIDNKYKRSYDMPKKPPTIEEIKEEDPFDVKRYYRRSRTLQGIFDRAKVEWLKKYRPEEVQREIEQINARRRGDK